MASQTTQSQPTDTSTSSFSSLETPKVAASTLDLLLIELVPLAQRMATELHTRDAKLLAASLAQKMTLHTSTSTTGALSKAQEGEEAEQEQEEEQSKRTSVKSSTVAGTKDGNEHEHENEEDEERKNEAVLWRLDALGFRVGQGLVEKFSINTPRPTTPLDMIKFICKDLWHVLFRKQIDNLKTNHRGTFVLTDNKFPALARMSVDRRRGPRGVDEALRAAQPFLYFPCGIIRGALSGFGLDVMVHAETTDLPMATFQIRTVGSKP